MGGQRARRFSNRFSKRFAWVMAWLLLLPLPGYAQEPAAEEGESTETSDEELTKDSIETTLQTIDGVYLNARLWLPKEPKSPKETPIVLLLHMRGKSQRDWFPFAQFLQQKGLAVCTFDFRGHGQSREVNPDLYVPVVQAMKSAASKIPNLIQEPVVPQGQRRVAETVERAVEEKDVKGRRKPSEKIEAAEEFRTGKEIAFALPIDLQTIKEFLITKHNEGTINIRRLGIVGAEMGALVALEWMQRAEFKDGRTRGWEKIDSDLAALVLLSPQTAYWGQKSPWEFNPEGNSIPLMVVASNEGKGADEAERVARKLHVPERELAKEEEASTDKPSKNKVKPRGKERPDSGLFKLDSKQVGSDLLRPAVEEIDGAIADFFGKVLTREKSRNWEKRVIDPDRSGFGSGN
jgi:alpha-beta hydrolase superfamily lysophospholipase